MRVHYGSWELESEMDELFSFKANVWQKIINFIYRWRFGIQSDIFIMHLVIWIRSDLVNRAWIESISCNDISGTEKRY